jgi:hypothetical protein
MQDGKSSDTERQQHSATPAFSSSQLNKSNMRGSVAHGNTMLCSFC